MNRYQKSKPPRWSTTGCCMLQKPRTSESLRRRSNTQKCDEDVGNKFNSKKSTVATSLMSEQKNKKRLQRDKHSSTSQARNQWNTNCPKGSKRTASCKTREVSRRRPRWRKHLMVVTGMTPLWLQQSPPLCGETKEGDALTTLVRGQSIAMARDVLLRQERWKDVWKKADVG